MTTEFGPHGPSMERIDELIDYMRSEYPPGSKEVELANLAQLLQSQLSGAVSVIERLLERKRQ